MNQHQGRTGRESSNVGGQWNLAADAHVPGFFDEVTDFWVVGCADLIEDMPGAFDVDHLNALGAQAVLHWVNWHGWIKEVLLDRCAVQIDPAFEIDRVGSAAIATQPLTTYGTHAKVLCGDGGNGHALLHWCSHTSPYPLGTMVRRRPRVGVVGMVGCALGSGSSLLRKAAGNASSCPLASTGVVAAV